MRKRRRSKSHSNSLHFRCLESRRLLAVTGFGTNDCPPDLDLSGLADQTVEVGERLRFNILNRGGSVTDLEASGTPTGDTIRLVLDPDTIETPIGATITEEGVFSWTPTTAGTFEIVVIALDDGDVVLADAETFIVKVAEADNNVAPELDAIEDQTAVVGEEFSLTIQASDSNVGDVLAYSLDPDDSPAGATIEKNDDGTATIRWTPTESDGNTTVGFRVLVTDDADNPLTDSEQFNVNVDPADEDTDPPTVASGPTGTFSTTFSSFDVDFDEEMGADAFDAVNYQLTIVGGPNDGQQVSILSVASSNDGTTATINLVDELPSGDYRLTLDADEIEDLAGNLLDGDSEFDFTIDELA